MVYDMGVRMYTITDMNSHTTRSAILIFPHQLFERHPALVSGGDVFLVEEFLFFRQYRFHKQKLAFHRGSMKRYADMLRTRGFTVSYIDAHDESADVRKLMPYLPAHGYGEARYADVTDDWLERRLSSFGNSIRLVRCETPMFMNTGVDIEQYFSGRNKFFQADWYARQRQECGMLVDSAGAPLGGKWSFDAMNRSRYPHRSAPPPVAMPHPDAYTEEALSYVNGRFPHHYGSVVPGWRYPETHGESREWFERFLRERFREFGPYQDAMVEGESVLHHSVLSPLLNVGLLEPAYVVTRAIDYAKEYRIPLNSLEGFLRQVVGWREFIRGVYGKAGRRQRTRNSFGFTKKLPSSFYDGTTGIGPVDGVIRKVLRTGYAHHIERMMVLGSFMFLCEFDPDDVYRWFMELFMDAYDWVMVPNVYGMSQHADGGMMSTKPYMNASGYLMKMGDFAPGPWQATWDGLFWRFVHVHRDRLSQNPRCAHMVKNFDRMDREVQRQHLKRAERFLEAA